MKKLFFVLGCFILSFGLNAQIKPAESGVVYGAVSESGDIVPVNKLEKNLKENRYEGKITGKVAEVCQAEGCWIKLEKADGSTMMVRARDHKFFMPTNLVGKEVVVEGEATVKEVTEAQRKHYAEDAGKSEKEIKKIKGTERQIVFQASGVKVL